MFAMLNRIKTIEFPMSCSVYCHFWRI